jgi:hypothetical protein
MARNELGTDVVSRCNGLGLLRNLALINGRPTGANPVVGLDGRDGLDRPESGAGGVSCTGAHSSPDSLPSSVALSTICDVTMLASSPTLKVIGQGSLFVDYRFHL